MNHEASCPFCDIASADDHERILNENEYAFVIRDGYPVSLGHSLVIPKRHTSSFFDTNSKERQALLELLDHARIEIDCLYEPAAYNIGINDGEAAGQTVLHLHLIPRYEENARDARGGVRWVVPEKAGYWSDQWVF